MVQGRSGAPCALYRRETHTGQDHSPKDLNCLSSEDGWCPLSEPQPHPGLIKSRSQMGVYQEGLCFRVNQHSLRCMRLGLCLCNLTSKLQVTFFFS